MSTDAMASRLYGNTTPEPQPAPTASQEQRTPSDEQRIAESLYAPPAPPPPRTDVPAEIAQLRAGDATRRMFNTAKAWANELPDGALDGIDSAEAREVLVDLGAEVDDVRALRSLSNTDGDAAGWRAQSEKLMTDRGFSTADLNAARRLVQRDPRVAAYLDATGLGNHPKVVERAVELARKALAAGTLTPTRSTK